jgi:ParB family chromosome partitioning protein
MRSTAGADNLGALLQAAYENGHLKGRQVIEAKRLIEKRQAHGPGSPNAQVKPPTSSYSLVRTYQKEVDRQRKMVLKAEHAHQRLLLVVQGLRKLFSDENFVNLLRAEGLNSLPNTCLNASTPCKESPYEPRPQNHPHVPRRLSRGKRRERQQRR